ncbi:MAG TPA: group II intron reverse transcriptase/maturase [Candidatus Macondimonas sp.]|nr:group II intron reverse transcriptase/maturase [Candidatus Macondimonas sp.]
MDAHNQSDAVSAAWSSWHDISWSSAHHAVGRLQTRIVKATKAGKWRKVRTLQSLLTRSTSAKALAVKQVTENQGRTTPGIDGQTWSTPEEKWQAVQNLIKKGYKPAPLRRIHIPKASGGKRPLGIPTMRDRAMQALHLLALDPVAETLADPHSYGFRKERSTADAIEQVRNVLGRRTSPKFVLEGDIKGCFDNISHDWLLANVCMDKAMLHKWLKSGYMERGNLYRTMAGTPQGGIVSPVLANRTLDGLQERIDTLFNTVREAREAKVHVVRYADDFVITGNSKDLLERRVKPIVSEFLAERGLTLSEAKTHVTHVEDGFDFLGWNVRMRKSRLIIQPSKRNVLAFLSKVRGTLNRQKGASQSQVIETLSPIIRGWANYHRSQMATRTFAECDHLIWDALWRWSVRRHPNKGRKWIKQRYFQQIKGRDWRFGEKDRLLPYLGGVRKKPHIKIKAEANPYDPEFDLYLSSRLAGRMINMLKGRKRLRWLWRFQDGLCPECGQKITMESGWNIHHVLPRRLGGADTTGNLVLLHPNCHRQVHAVNKRLQLLASS